MMLTMPYEKITIVVWRGVIVDYMFITHLIGENEIIIPAKAEEIKAYWDVRERDKKDY